MGNYLTVNIGPYIKIYDEPYKIENQKSINTCSNIECVEHSKLKKSKFCDTCGSEIKKIDITIEELKVFNYFELLEEFGDEDIVYRIWDNNNDNNIILGINYKVKGLKNISFSEYDFEAEYQIQDKEESINILKNSKNYKSFFEFLNTKGIKYEIKFGITCDCS